MNGNNNLTVLYRTIIVPWLSFRTTLPSGLTTTGAWA